MRLWEAVGVGHHRPSLEQIDSPRNSHDSRGGASDVLPESKHSADSDCRALVLGGVIASKQHSRSAGGLIGEVRRWRGWGCRSVTGRRIARHLGRCRSVISREIRRNTTKTRGYQAVGADVKAQRRRARPQQRKVATDPVMQARVEADLAASWTPNEIAGVAACAWRRQTRLSAVWRTLPTRKAAPSPVRRSISTSTRPHVVSSPGGDLLAVQADQALAPHERPVPGLPDRGDGAPVGAGTGCRAAPGPGALGGRPDHREERHLLCGDPGGADERVHRVAGPALQARRAHRGRGHRVLQRPARDDAQLTRVGPGQRDGPARESLASHSDAGLLRRPPLALGSGPARRLPRKREVPPPTGSTASTCPRAP